MNVDFCNCPLKIQESIRTSTPKVGAHFGVWGFIPALSYIHGSMKCDSRASFLARIFTSPCFGHEPRAKVATILLLNSNSIPLQILIY